MKTLIVVNEKGGVGKSTLSIHLAFYLALGKSYFGRSYKVAVIDLDSQGNTSKALGKYSCGIDTHKLFDPSKEWDNVIPTPTEENPIALFPASRNLINIDPIDLKITGPAFKKSIMAINAAGYELCIIDSPPALGNRMRAGILSSDFILGPIKVDQFSIDGIQHLMETVKLARQINRKVQFLGMVANMVDRRDREQIKNLMDLRKAYGNFLLPATIGSRNTFQISINKRIPLWKVRRSTAGEAKREMIALTTTILEKMGVSNNDQR